MRVSKLLPLTGILLATLVRADAPKPQPAPSTLYNGRIQFTPPANWSAVKSPQTSEIVAIYMADDHDGYLAIQVLPENAVITPDAARKILGQLKVNHKKAGQEVVEEAAIEKDERFAIKIHERYKTKDGKIADETHLYRQVAGRALELDVQSLSDDSAHIEDVQRAGEEMLLSAEWQTKKPVKK